MDSLLVCFGIIIIHELILLGNDRENAYYCISSVKAIAILIRAVGLDDAGDDDDDDEDGDDYDVGGALQFRSQL